MSGRKITYVDTSELADLRRDASLLSSLRADLPERIENAVRKTQAGMNARLAPIEARQRDFIQAIHGLNADIRGVEQGMAERIADQARKTRHALQETAVNAERQRRELRQELHDTAQHLEEADREVEQRLTRQIHESERRLLDLTEDLRVQMGQQEQRLSAAIAKESEERQKGLAAANQRIDAIHKDRQRLEGIAKSQLQAAQTMHDFIESHYQHEHFAPKQLKRLERDLASARKVLDQGASEAALAQANAAYQNLSDLRLELERLESEWRILREQVLQNAGRLLAEAQANRKVAKVEVPGEVAEADYWTGGKMTELEKELGITISQAENEKSPLTIAALREQVEKNLPGMECRLDDIIVEAQTAVLRSQNRTNLADLAMQALWSIGFRPEGAVYEGDDMRGGYVAKAKNKAGSEVVISVTPEGDRDRVTIDSFEPGPRAPGELLQRSRDVAQTMRDHGLEATDPVMESEEPSEANRDLEVVRKRKPQLAKRQAR